MWCVGGGVEGKFSGSFVPNKDLDFGFWSWIKLKDYNVQTISGDKHSQTFI